MDITKAIALVGQLNQELAVAEARHGDAKGALASVQLELETKYKTSDRDKLTGMQQKAERDLDTLLQEISSDLETVPEA